MLTPRRVPDAPAHPGRSRHEGWSGFQSVAPRSPATTATKPTTTAIVPEEGSGECGAEQPRCSTPESVLSLVSLVPVKPTSFWSRWICAVQILESKAESPETASPAPGPSIAPSQGRHDRFAGGIVPANGWGRPSASLFWWLWEIDRGCPEGPAPLAKTTACVV